MLHIEENCFQLFPYKPISVFFVLCVCVCVFSADRGCVGLKMEMRVCQQFA